ncbi:hypothetical protein [Stenomitos frigidus]|uniref:hypothetical protein n=1 Tax=Stenomitos frigidus TaxID=1886765 RepID=UPI0015E64151|nr:hypothetical protein [Stenomitos frigidus]
MFEKLLLAATITFSLNLFIGMSVQSTKQSSVITQPAPRSVSIAKAENAIPSLWSLFQ